MNVLSLFDGMSCGQIALNRAGIEYNNYYAAEIDKYAIKVTQANYPNTIQMGSVTEWRTWDIDWGSVGLFFGGSPCQGFSFAGKQLAFDDPRSKLFFVYVDILEHIKKHNPKVKFMLENVRMKKEHLDLITKYVDVEPVKINSDLVSGQHRIRFYWCNWAINQPDDKGVLMKDILQSQSEFDDSHYYSSTVLKRLNTDGLIRCGRGGYKYACKEHDKPAPITARHYKGMQSQPYPVIKEIVKLGNTNPSGNGMNGDVFSSNGLCPTLTTNKGEGIKIKDQEKYRKLTPIECERLQTVSDNYTNHVSNSQRYKMLGNGWTVEIIAHIFKGMDSEPVCTEKNQLEFDFMDNTP